MKRDKEKRGEEGRIGEWRPGLNNFYVAKKTCADIVFPWNISYYLLL